MPRRLACFERRCAPWAGSTRRAVLAAACGWALLLGAGMQSADNPTEEQKALYNKKIQPLLKKHCYECHGPDKQESGLRLDQKQAALKGGNGGPAVVPFEVEKSKLIEAVNYTGDLQMPPDAKLDDDAIKLLTDWIKQGAPWPESKK